MKNFTLLIAVCLLFLQVSQAQPTFEYYQNPVIAGDLPDSRVIRVRGT